MMILVHLTLVGLLWMAWFHDDERKVEDFLIFMLIWANCSALIYYAIGDWIFT